MENFENSAEDELIPIDAINPPAEWRRINEDNVDVLAQSMNTVGQLQPIGLQPAKDQERYDLEWGEHRRLGAEKTWLDANKGSSTSRSLTRHRLIS